MFCLFSVVGSIFAYVDLLPLDYFDAGKFDLFPPYSFPFVYHGNPNMLSFKFVRGTRSEACPLGMQAAPSSISTFGTFFRGDLVMNKILPLLLIQEEQLSVTCERMCTK